MTAVMTVDPGGPSVGWRAFQGGLSRASAERSGLAVYAVFFVLPPAVLGGLWRVAAGAAGGEIVGYDATALVWYVAAAEAAILPLRIRLIEEIGDDIGSGRVAVEMLRPASVLAVRLATEAGWLVPRLVVSIVLAVPLASILGGRPEGAGALALALPSLVLAVLVNLVGHHLFAAAAFWVRDAKGMWFLYQKLVFVVGGMLLPLEVLPAWLEAVAKSLPFMAMAYAPARLAAGRFEPWLLAVQLGWLVVLTVVTVRVFEAGQRRLVRIGS